MKRVVPSVLFVAGSMLAQSVRPAPKASVLNQSPMNFEPNMGQAPAGVRFVARGAHYSVRMEDRGPVLLFHSPGAKSAATLALTFRGSDAHPAPRAVNRLEATTNYLLGRNPAAWHRHLPTYERVRYDRVYPGVDVAFYGTQGSLEYDFEIAPHADTSQIRLHFDGLGRAALDGSGSLRFAGGGDGLRERPPVAYQLRAWVHVPVDARYSLLPTGDVAFSLGDYDRSLPLVIDPTLSYATYLGGSGSDGVTGLQVDASGNLYVSGVSSSAALQTAGAAQAYKGIGSSSVFVDTGDAFVAKYNIAGKLQFLTYIGGTRDDAAMALALDPDGNIYVAGNTTSTDFPTTSGAYQTKFGGLASDFFWVQGDAFAAKLSPDGSRILYGTYLGGSMNDGAWGIAVDAQGNATVVGNTISTDFPTTPGAISRVYHGAANSAVDITGDGFLTRLNPSGSALLYSTYIGGRSNDVAHAVALDASGNAYVCGLTYSGDFPTTSGAFQTKFRGVETNNYDAAADDAWVMEINTAGAMVYSTYVGGSFRDTAFGIAVDSTGDAYITGRTMSSDFPVTAGAVQSKYGGTGAVGSTSDWLQGDAFVAKLNPSGTALLYATYLGGSGDDSGLSIAVDSAGDAYVVGFTLSSSFQVSADAQQSKFAGFGGQGVDVGSPPPDGVVNFGDAFITKLGPQGALLYSSFFGGAGDDAAFAVAVDSGHNVYIAGSTMSSNMPLANGAQTAYAGGTAQFPRGDGFVTRFDFGGALAAVPAAVAFLPGSPTSGNAGAAVTLGVAVTDSKGAAAAGVPVTFTATGATVQTSPVVTDAAGHATTVVTLSTSASTATITATVAGLAPINASIGIVTAPVPAITAVTNTATQDNRFAPGAQVAVTGTNLPTSASAGATVGGTAASVVGTPTATTWVIAIPSTLAAGPTTVQIGTSKTFAITLAAYAPALYTVDGTGFGEAVAVSSTGKTVNTGNPALPGDVITIYATGLGAVANGATVTKPTATIDGIPASVLAANPVPPTPGRYGVGVTVPATATAGLKNLILSIAGFTSNTVLVSIGSLTPPNTPAIASAQNGASYQDGFPVGGWLQIKGTNLAAVASDTWDKAIVNGNLPTKLDGVSVTVGGQPAYIFFVSPGQVNVVAPNIAPGPVQIVVKNDLGTSAAFTATAYAQQPAFFPWPGGYAVASHYPDFTFAVKDGTFPGLTTVPAKPKDVLILWGAGFGATSPATPQGVQIPATATFSTANSVTVTVGGIDAQVYGAALAPGFAGLFQVAIQVPDGLKDNDYPVIATINGVKSAAAMLTVHQ